MVEELRARARNALLVKEIATEEQASKATGDLMNVEGMTEEFARKLIDNEVMSQEDLAELATDEVVQFLEVDEEAAGALIMAARAPWFEEA